MREQVITPRMSARSAAANVAGKGRPGGLVQKPARRNSATPNSRAQGGRLRKVLAYLPLAGRIMLAVLAGVLLFAGYRAAASASFFQARIVDVNPTTRASSDEIARVVRRATAQTGVWRADLAALSAELERLPWVRRAVISRVLPDGLRVRVTERTPLAVVHTAGGKFIWVDDEAVALDALAPTDHLPAFFIRGWDEAGTADAQAENRARLQTYAELARQWEAAGLNERVSEVSLSDVRDVRAQLAGDDSQIEVRLGSRDFGNRLRRALTVLDEQRNTPRGPFITRIETLDNRTIVGTSTGAQLSGESAGDNHTLAESGDVAPARSAIVSTATARRSKKAAAETGKERDARAQKEQDKKEEAKKKTKGETRPRRVG